MERVEIYTSKKKSLLLLLVSIAFVALGIWLFMEADRLTNWRIKNPLFIRGIGIASILFFGLGIIVFIKRLFKSEIALILDPAGISVKPKNPNTEFIKWKDIIGFEEIKIHNQSILLIDVKNPEYWLEKETSTFRKKLMQINIRNYNTPFNIGSSGLDISSTALNELLNKYFEKYKNS